MKVTFTHLVTNRPLTIINGKNISAVMSANMEGSTTLATWLFIDNFPAPVPVIETEEEVLEKLEVTKTKHKE